MPYDFESLKNTFGRAPTGEGRGLGTVVSGGGGYYSAGGVGGMAGAAPRGYNPASGGVPGVTDPTKTVLGDLGNIGGIVSGITAQQLEALRKQYPTEYFATLQQLLLNTQRRAGGDISDLLPELQTRNAEAGIAGGYSGSGMENTKLLRDLGLTRYGVEEQALKDLGLIKEGTPTVKPYDPTGIIQSLIDAQARADLYAAAPIPEEAYRRARDAARGAGGGGGGGGAPGVRYGGGAGAGGGTVDDILKRYGSGSGLGVFMARGTKEPEPYTGPAPYGSIPYNQFSAGGPGHYGKYNSYEDWESEFYKTPSYEDWEEPFYNTPSGGGNYYDDWESEFYNTPDTSGDEEPF